MRAYPREVPRGAPMFVPQLPAELATDAVPEILGRPALTFAVWARDHAADFR